MTTPRGPSSRKVLAIQWTYPVFTAEADGDGGRTSAVAARKALSPDEAYALLAGDDPRPLLVLRECLHCNGTDDALLTRQADNERTMLLTRWFRCIKLPPAVTEDEDHPVSALFAGEDPPHLFVAQRDGAGRIDLKGDQSRTELWGAMNAALAVAYDKVDRRKGPKRPLGDLVKHLDELDALDEELLLTERRLEDEIEDDGPDGRKAKKLFGELADLKKEREELFAELVEAAALELRSPEERAEALAKSARAGR